MKIVVPSFVKIYPNWLKIKEKIPNPKFQTISKIPNEKKINHERHKGAQKEKVINSL
jgi:hypothetical protein